MRHGVKGFAICRVANFGTMRRILGKAGLESLLERAAQRISGSAEDIEVLGCARDVIEFSFEAADHADAISRIDALLETLRAMLIEAGLPDDLRFEAGAAVTRVAGEDTLLLVEAAEAALARAADENGIVVLDLCCADVSVDRLTLTRELPEAIAAGQMFLHYQPKVNVRRQEVASAEALIRWRHPTRGLVLPGEFIAAAEQSGQIGSLTLWTLCQVIADQRALAASGHDLRLFLNISGMLLADGDFVQAACAIIAAHPDAKLGFEITETAVIRDPECAIRHLQLFADHGIILAIDDYGAGLSSLAYLKQLPAKELKIDKMFVTQLTSSHRDPLIVRSTIDLAHALEMEVTAEGVETPAALALLSVMGCDLVQGYLISRPVPFEALLTYLGEQDRIIEAMASKPVFLRSGTSWKRA